MSSFNDWPNHEEEQRLFAQLHAGDRRAREAIARRYLPLLTGRLAREFPYIAPELRDSATDDALVKFLCAPDRFDPTRSTLGSYLRMAARYDLLNLIQQEARARRGIALDSVAEPIDHRNHIPDDGLSWDCPQLVAEIARLNTQEQIALDLMQKGIRNSAICADQLGLTHLPAPEQGPAVKRLKDRVKRRLVRAMEDQQ